MYGCYIFSPALCGYRVLSVPHYMRVDCTHFFDSNKHLKVIVIGECVCGCAYYDVLLSFTVISLKKCRKIQTQIHTYTHTLFYLFQTHVKKGMAEISVTVQANICLSICLNFFFFCFVLFCFSILCHSSITLLSPFIIIISFSAFFF